MLDYSLLRNHTDLIAKKLLRRNFFLNINEISQQENLRKILQKKIEYLRSSKKSKSKKIGMVKSCDKKNFQLLCRESNKLNNELIKIKKQMEIVQKKIKKYTLSIPNIPDDQIPNGLQENDNLEIFRWGKPFEFNFSLKDHIFLGKLKGGLSFSNSVKLSGSRFVVMKGQIAHLHRALSQFMIDLHTKTHGYEEYYLPYLINKKSLYGSGQLPKFSDDLFHTKSLQSNKDVTYTLIPTAEVPLINLVQDVILNEEELPIKMTAHTPCFRAEAGTYGKNSRGLIRMHQFDKVELVQIVHPNFSMNILEEITQHAEKVLQLLNLPYRKVLLCAGKLGFSSCKTYDLEVWMPSFNDYCEVSSCSNIGDFQARRIKARYRSKKNKKIKFLHTLNASGLALSRTLAAILENYQLCDGRVAIPSILHSYMNGLTHINC